MKRRSFLGAVVGLVAAPSLIEKIRPTPSKEAFLAWAEQYVARLRAPGKTQATLAALDHEMKQVYAAPLLEHELWIDPKALSRFMLDDHVPPRPSGPVWGQL